MRYIFVFVVLISFTNCSSLNSDESKIIRIKGSDTMLLLNQRLAAEFMKEHKGLSVYVDGGGTGTGVEALIRNNVEICAASRPLEPVEIQKFGEEFSTVGMSFLIARDALSIYINSKNNVKNLTIDQIAKIFQCEINNWRVLGETMLKYFLLADRQHLGHIYTLLNMFLKGKICVIPYQL